MSVRSDSEALTRGRVLALIPAMHKSFVTSALSIVIFGALLFRHSPTGAMVWLGIRAITSIGCLIALRQPWTERDPPARTLRTLAIIMAVSGVVWGLIPLLIRPEAAEWQAVVVLWLFGNQAVVTAVCSPSRGVFFAAVGTVTLVGVIGIASHGDAFAGILAALLLLGGAYSVSIFSALHRSVIAAINGQLTANELAMSLQDRQVELAAANDALAEIAYQDALTRLPNRRAFTSAIADSDSRVRATGWLGIIDLDHFKSINDTYGHGHGDDVLVEAAGRWRFAVPDDVLIARLGGDEFVIAFANKSYGEARELGNLLVAALDSPITVHDGRQLEVSCSIGIVSVEGGQQLATGLASADAALYTIKSSGRKGVFVRSTGIEAPTSGVR